MSVKTTMEVYKAETEEIIRRFRLKRLTRDQCIVGLYDAFSNALPCLCPEDLPKVRAIMQANDEAVRMETEKRRAHSGILANTYTH